MNPCTVAPTTAVLPVVERPGRTRVARFDTLLPDYLPLTLTGQDYLELLSVAWRAINTYGIRIDGT